jgi:hypothetical protein
MADAHESGLDLGIRDLMHHKTAFDEALKKNDFSEIAGYVVHLADAPELLASGVTIPEYSSAGNSSRT